MSETEFMDFNELIDMVMLHLQNEKFIEGYDLVNEYLDDFPNDAAHLNFLRMCLLSQMGEVKVANSVLERMLMNKIWYSEKLLRDTPHLEPLQNNTTYEELVKYSIKIQAQDFGSKQPILVIHPEGKCTKEESPCPTILALHANGENPIETLTQWGDAAHLGWVVGVPKSSVTLWAGSGHYWHDYKDAAEEIRSHFDTMNQEYNLSTNQVIIGGREKGAELALWLSIKKILPVQGFILINPIGPFFTKADNWLPLIQTNKELNLRGYVLFDVDNPLVSRNGIERAISLLSDVGIETHLEPANDFQGQYPVNMMKVIENAMDFIFK
jgi:hypothetical protein